MADLAIELESTVEAPHEARQTIRDGFAERLPATTLYDLLTIVSELVANGVHHGTGETVRVRVSIEGDGRIEGEVENDGRGEVSERPVDLRTGRGLGLRIVAALADRWRVFVDDSTRVRFELHSP